MKHDEIETAVDAFAKLLARRVADELDRRRADRQARLKQCAGTTVRGARCRQPALDGGDYCFFHVRPAEQPEQPEQPEQSGDG